MDDISCVSSGLIGGIGGIGVFGDFWVESSFHILHFICNVRFLELVITFIILRIRPYQIVDLLYYSLIDTNPKTICENDNWFVRSQVN